MISDETKNMLISIYKSFTGFIPGGHISNELLEHKNRLNQERLNHFTKLVKEAFENFSDKNIDFDNFSKDDFVDSIDLIIKKILNTRSETKINYFKNILLRNTFEKNNYELFERYVHLLDEISETQLMIISVLNFHYKDKLDEVGIIKVLIGKNREANNIIDVSLQKYVLSNGHTMTNDEFLFYILDLKSKGLIDQVPSDLASDSTNNPVYYIRTVIGEGFINFISDYNY